MLTYREMININIPVLFLLLAMAAIAFAQIPQGGPPHISQWGSNFGRREINIEYDELPSVGTKSINWTTCDPLGPKRYCHNCTTRVICKQMGGGILKQCGPWQHFCNNGLCSTMPSKNCSSNN